MFGILQDLEIWGPVVRTVKSNPVPRACVSTGQHEKREFLVATNFLTRSNWLKRDEYFSTNQNALKNGCNQSLSFLGADRIGLEKFQDLEIGTLWIAKSVVNQRRLLRRKASGYYRLGLNIRRNYELKEGH